MSKSALIFFSKGIIFLILGFYLASLGLPSAEVGGIVKLVLRDHSHWKEDSKGNRLTRTDTWTSIEGYSAETSK